MKLSIILKLMLLLAIISLATASVGTAKPFDDHHGPYGGHDKPGFNHKGYGSYTWWIGSWGYWNPWGYWGYWSPWRHHR